MQQQQTEPVSRQWFRFFHANMGGVVGQAALGAIALARAYQRFKSLESDGRARFVWSEEDDSDISWMDERQLAELRNGQTTMEWCRLEVWRDEDERTGFHGRWAGVGVSLSGIHLGRDRASNNYRKVVEAELAAEYFGEEGR